MAIENTGSKQEYVTTLGQMYIVDKDGNQYQIAVTNKAMENINNSLDGTVVAKSKKTGWVGFEVPTTATGLTFRYNASFWNDKAILVELQYPHAASAYYFKVYLFKVRGGILSR